MRIGFLLPLKRFFTHNNNSEELDILKKKLKCQFRSVGMLEIDTIMNKYLNDNLDQLDKSKIKLLYNLIDTETTNLLKLFYFYSNKENRSVNNLARFFKNKEEKEIKDMDTLLCDILSSNEKFMHSK